MSVQAKLELAAAEMALLGVRARPIWSVREGWPGTAKVSPGVAVGEMTFTCDQSVLDDEDTASDWAQMVATLARSVEA